MERQKNNPSWEQTREWQELADSPDQAESWFGSDPFLDDLAVEGFFPYPVSDSIPQAGEGREPVTLASVAEVFRRPVRKKEAWSGAEARQGFRMDGSILARELGMDSFDNATGFVDIDKGPQVVVDSEYVPPEDFLQKNDIVFVHVGTKERLGSVGFVRHNMNWCLPGPSLAVIRARNINAVWLYYFLRSPATWQEAIDQAEEQLRRKKERVRERTEAEGRGSPVSSLMFLRMGDVRRITFMPPSQREIAGIKGMDTVILEKAGQIRQIRDEIFEEQEQIRLFLTSGSYWH